MEQIKFEDYINIYSNVISKDWVTLYDPNPREALEKLRYLLLGDKKRYIWPYYLTIMVIQGN